MRGSDESQESVDRVASEWVTRCAEGLSSDEERELAGWLGADSRHREAYSRMTGVWTIFDRAEDSGTGTEMVTRLRVRQRARRRRRIQAAAAVGMLAAGLIFSFSPGSFINPRTGSSAEVAFESVRKLPDGSIVELNDGAQIAVQYDPAVRTVRLLAGEAHFRVEKDSARPFIVQAGAIDVAAVGTAFTVQLSGHSVEVIVTEGRIAVESARSAASAPAVSPTIVDAGNSVLVEVTDVAAPLTQIRAMSEAEIEQRLAWRLPRLEFGGTELAHAVAQMNRSNRLQIVIEDPSIGKLRISGVFHSDNLEGFVRIVEATFDLKSERRGEEQIVLRRP